MPDIDYSIGVNSKDATRGLKQLQDQVKKTSDAFGGLKTAIAGLAIGSFIRESFQVAAGMNDIARATGLALETVIGFSSALTAAGGTADRARDGLSDLAKNIGEAALGSTELQAGFRRLGIGIEELRTLGIDEILLRVVDGLDKMEDKTKATAIAQRLMGESTKGIDFSKLNSQIRQNITESKDQAESTREAAEAQNNFRTAIEKLQLQVVKAITPITEFANALLEADGAVKAIINTLLGIGAAILSFTLLGKVVRGVGLIFGGLKKAVQTVWRAVGPAKDATYSWGNIWKEFLKIPIVEKLKVIPLLLADVGKWLAKNIPLVGALAAGYAFLKDTINDALTSVGEFLGIIDEKTEGVKKSVDDLGKAVTDSGNKVKGPVREVVDGLATQKQAIDDITDTLKEKTTELERSLKYERDNVGVSEDVLRVNEKVLEVKKLFAETQKQLNDKLKEYQRDEEANAELIQKTKDALVAVKKEEEQVVAIVKRITEETVKRENALEKVQEREEAIKKVLEDAKGTSDTFLKDLNRYVDDLQFEFDTLNMSNLEKQVAGIERTIRVNLAKTVADLQKLLTDELIDDTTRRKIEATIENISSAAEKAVKTQSDLAKKSYNYQRSFAYGWRKAFNDYADSATNAAKKAGEIFNKTMSGIEDMLVNFVKTGKFEWKNFVADMLETLLRSQIQQTLANVFSIGGNQGGGGILDTLGSLFGGASGAQRGNSQAAPLYVYDVSGGFGGIGGGGGSFIGNLGGGSAGGGIMGTIGNVVSSIGSGIGGTIGSVVSGISSVVGGIGSTISNIVGGIGDFFGGFFADGGTLPAGKFGIVGERGPELITGPANITPLNAGGAVTYNINAVDAASFKALVARDPGFIHAVAMQGARTIPGRR